MEIDLTAIEVVDLVRFADLCARTPGSWRCAGCGDAEDPRSAFAALIRDPTARASRRAIVVCRRCATSIVRQSVVEE